MGLALVGSIAEGTRKSLIESGAGHLQLYHSAGSAVPFQLVADLASGSTWTARGSNAGAGLARSRQRSAVGRQPVLR